MSTSCVLSPPPAARAQFIREQMPGSGLFAGHEWRISPEPFSLGELLAEDLQKLGRVLLQFYRAVNLLYRKSLEGKQPAWIAEWLDQGKPAELLALQRSAAFRNAVPNVIRPDLLLTEQGTSITELDSVPGGIGLTAFLNQTYSTLGDDVIGGAGGVLHGFESIFGNSNNVHIVISEEAAAYRPEMEWLAAQLNNGGNRFKVHGPAFKQAPDGDAVYRFFELFDLENVPGASSLFAKALEQRIRVTPPPKPVFEEKMLFALLWNRNLQPFWLQELGGSFFKRLLQLVPRTWMVDPSPLPPQGAIPDLNLTDWAQLKNLSQRERELILKVSGFSPHAWGARGVYLGSDLSHADWAAAVDKAIAGFGHSPFVLQRYHKPALVNSCWFDFEKGESVPMPGRVRLCPYYFVKGEGDSARANLGGILATICPANKKIIHGMSEAIFAPCSV